MTQREEFENYAAGLGYNTSQDTREMREGGYQSSHTHLMWATWQAAQAAQPVQPAENQEIARLTKELVEAKTFNERYLTKVTEMNHALFMAHQDRDLVLGAARQALHCLNAKNVSPFSLSGQEHEAIYQLKKAGVNS